MSRTRPHALALAALVLALVAGGPVRANAWTGECFDARISGQAVYEAMAIHPQAVRGPDGFTYVAYQGVGLDPYIVRFDSEGTMEGPVRIGTNPIADSRIPGDTHGAPSLVIDKLGFVHVFYGAHLSTLRHARSAAPLSIDSWVGGQATVPHKATYSQPFLADDGTIMLSYRLDAAWGRYTAGSWMLASFTDNGTTFAESRAIVSGTDSTMWYGNTRRDESGRIHGVFIRKARLGGQYERSRVYYLYRDAGDPKWRDVRGTALAVQDPSRGITLSDLDASSSRALVYRDDKSTQNQAVVAAGPDGSPGVLFISGSGVGPTSHRWLFSTWNGVAWTSEAVAYGDHAFDSSALGVTDDGGFEAYLTQGGTRGVAAIRDTEEDRGGDIVRYLRAPASSGWARDSVIATAAADTRTVLNDPQIVAGASGGPRLLFGEWNTDGTNFSHELFLWGDEGFYGRDFSTNVRRIGGDDRYDVAAAASRSAFPVGSVTAVVVNGTKYPDALAGTPLATLYNAPILLTESGRLRAETASELRRLRCTDVIVLGGTTSVNSAVITQLKSTGSVRRVRRIGGADRYETAALIASDMAAKAGRKPRRAFVVSGDAFAEGLAAGSVAAVRQYPVLLTRHSSIPAPTARALASLDVTATWVVGDSTLVSNAVRRALPDGTRIAGADRYETTALLAESALDGGFGLPRSFDTDQVLIVNGDSYADALAASAFAGRVRGPLVMTRAGSLPSVTDQFLRRRAHHVYDAYLVGGPKTIDSATASAFAAAVRAGE